MYRDDDLSVFDEVGVKLPPGAREGRLEHDAASLWYADFGSGPPVLLLHGGMGNAGNFGLQVPALLDAGYRVVAMDTRGHGRSTRDGHPFGYRRLSGDARALLDHLGIMQAAVVGWSDGAVSGLMLAEDTPDRVTGLVFFACNVSPDGTLPFVMSDTIGRCLSRHRKDYAALSSKPDHFDDVFEAVGQMQRSQPNYSEAELGRIGIPFLSLIGENDEFIRREHAQWIAASIPGAKFQVLPRVGHFAPLQRPEVFNEAMLVFLTKVLPGR